MSPLALVGERALAARVYVTKKTRPEPYYATRAKHGDADGASSACTCVYVGIFYLLHIKKDHK